MARYDWAGKCGSFGVPERAHHLLEYAANMIAEQMKLIELFGMENALFPMHGGRSTMDRTCERLSSAQS